MGYENAISTQLLDVQCALCGKGLRDAPSIEAGIGPDCAADNGVPHGLPHNVRDEANKLIHRIAINQTGIDVREMIERLHELGCTAAAERITQRLDGKAKKLPPVRVEFTPTDDLLLFSPYNAGAVSALRGVPGRRWDREFKVNKFPATKEVFDALCAVLLEHYEGKFFGVTCALGVVKCGKLDSTDDPKRFAAWAARRAGWKLSDKPVAPPAPAKPKASIFITHEGTRMSVKTPYNPDVVSAMRRIPGRKWNGAAKVNTFPRDEEGGVIRMLRAHFAGAIAVAPDGSEFTLNAL
jgi:hypothetical protein